MNGKWADPTFPRTGWDYIAKEDRGDYGRAICQVCEVQRLRYAHLMKHVQYPDGLWSGCDCAEMLCPEKAEDIRKQDSHMRYEGEKRKQRSQAVEGEHYLNPWFKAKSNPLVEMGKRLRLTILPFPKPRKVVFAISPWSKTWSLDAEGQHTGLLFPVATYPTNLKTGESEGGWPPCHFGAVMFRKSDLEAIHTLTHGKPSSYTILCEKRYKPTETVIWSEVGAATWRQSEPFLRTRAQQFTNPEGTWDLSKVIEPHEIESGMVCAKAFEEEPWI